MRLILLLLSLMFVLTIDAQEQDVEIMGWIKLLNEDTFLEGASVRVVRAADSILVDFSFTDQKGMFSVKLGPSDSVCFFVFDYLGCEQLLQEHRLQDGKSDLDTVFLTQDDNLFDVVTVVSTILPMHSKGDTITFNADYFNTDRISSAEDLLEVLPGVMIDSEGNLYANGKPVNKILINGKPYFKDDFRQAIKDLPAEFITQVQVFNSRTKSESFMGDEGNPELKTLNLIIEDDQTQPFFGNLTVGAGSENRFEVKGGLNYFSERTHLTILTGANNTNGNDFGNTNANLTRFNKATSPNLVQRHGISYVHEISKKITLNGNYFLLQNLRENKSNSYKTQFLPSNQVFTKSNSFSIDQLEGHNMNAGIGLQLTPLLLIDFNMTMTRHKINDVRKDTAITFLMNEVFENSTYSAFDNLREKDSYGGYLTITKKFKKRRDALIFSFNGRNEIENQFLKNDVDAFIQSGPSFVNFNRNQQITNKALSKMQSVSFVYKLRSQKYPINIDVGIAYNSKMDADQSLVFDKQLGGEELISNANFSRHFETFYRYLVPSIVLLYKKKKSALNFSVRSKVSNLNYADLLNLGNDFSRKFETLSIKSNFRYQLNSKSTWTISYLRDNKTPQLLQLQPFVNALDSLNVIEGNPNLKASITHQLSSNFQSYDLDNERSFNANLIAIFHVNQVLMRSIIDDNLAKKSDYINLSGAYELYGNLNFNQRFKLDSFKTIKLDLIVRPMMSRKLHFNNNLRYASYTYSLTPGIIATLAIIRNMNFIFAYQTVFSKTVFNLDNQAVQDLFTHQISTGFDVDFTKNLRWHNQLFIASSTPLTAIPQNNGVLWNSAITYSTKNQRLKLSLEANDLFNNNNGFTQTSTLDYLEDSERTVLKRYIMLKLNWTFKCSTKNNHHINH